MTCERTVDTAEGLIGPDLGVGAAGSLGRYLNASNAVYELINRCLYKDVKRGGLKILEAHAENICDNILCPYNYLAWEPLA